MDRVNLPGEAPGSATYYMGSAPEEYGTRLYEMQKYSGALIREALMDIGKSRRKPHIRIASSDEYEDMIWNSRGRAVYSCIFDLQYHDPDVIVITDFIAKRLTLQVDPELDQKRKARFAEFFEILTEPDYYVTREMEEIEDALKIPGVFQKLAIVASVILLAVCVLVIFGVFDDTDGIARILSLLQIISALFLAVYYGMIEIKKFQNKRRRRTKVK